MTNNLRDQQFRRIALIILINEPMGGCISRRLENYASELRTKLTEADWSPLETWEDLDPADFEEPPHVALHQVQHGDQDDILLPIPFAGFENTPYGSLIFAARKAGIPTLLTGLNKECLSIMQNLFKSKSGPNYEIIDLTDPLIDIDAFLQIQSAQRRPTLCFLAGASPRLALTTLPYLASRSSLSKEDFTRSFINCFSMGISFSPQVLSQDHYISSVWEITGFQDQTITISEIFKLRLKEINKDLRLVGSIIRTGIVPQFWETFKLEFLGASSKIFNS